MLFGCHSNPLRWPLPPTAKLVALWTLLRPDDALDPWQVVRHLGVDGWRIFKPTEASK